MSLYFNANLLPELSGEYIAWCDGMGTGQALSSSLRRAANFIFKLHTAFSDALNIMPPGHGIRVYPIMDGMYVTSPNKRNLQKVLSTAFRVLAESFIETPYSYHRFLVRGGIAYGAAIHGADISEDAFVHGIGTHHEEGNREAFRHSHLDVSRRQLLLGSGMLAAYTSESLAPLFGFYVDDSALAVPQLVDATDKGFHTKLWRWWQQDQALAKTAQQLWQAVQEHYAEASARSREIGYPVDSLTKHRSWAAEYFRDF